MEFIDPLSPCLMAQILCPIAPSMNYLRSTSAPSTGFVMGARTWVSLQGFYMSRP